MLKDSPGAKWYLLLTSPGNWYPILLYCHEASAIAKFREGSMLPPILRLHCKCYHNSPPYGRHLYSMSSPLCLLLCTYIQPRKHGSPQGPCNPTSWTDATPAMQAAAPKYTCSTPAQPKHNPKGWLCTKYVCGMLRDSCTLVG